VDLGVDGKGGEVDGFIAFNDVAIFVDKNEVGDSD
jgi:hypothetical protein